MLKEIEKAVEVLKNGGTLLYPTDTVWGIGCDATNEEAVAKVYQIKQRPDHKALITLVADVEQLEQYVGPIPAVVKPLLGEERPTTIIYPKAEGLASNLVGADGSAAIRIPKSAFCVALIKALGHALVSTSANISGEPTALHYDDISLDIKGAVDHIIPLELSDACSDKSSRILLLKNDGKFDVIRA